MPVQDRVPVPVPVPVERYAAGQPQRLVLAVVREPVVVPVPGSVQVQERAQERAQVPE